MVDDPNTDAQVPPWVESENFYRGGPMLPNVAPERALYIAGFEYWRAELPILALSGKAPHPRHSPHGFKEPISSPEAWKKACADPTVTGVGIAVSPNLFVLDIDAPEGWVALRKAGIFPLIDPTAVTITSRGAHFWFVSAIPVVSRASGARFLPHVDLKASGYVAAPPSLHPSGERYRWKGAALVSNGYVYAADAPAALLDLLDDLDFRDRALGPSRELALAALDLSPLAAHLRHAPEGERNGTLNWCALRAGTNGASLSATLDALLPVALAIGLTPRESQATIKSGWTAGNEQRHG